MMPGCRNWQTRQTWGTFYIRAKDYNRNPKRALSTFDIPTTLLASRNAIELILGGRCSVGLTIEPGTTGATGNSKLRTHPAALD